jgi:proteasome accessory factor B
MTARKSERLMNLLITLLVSRGYVTKQKLREVIPDYKAAATEDAFEKMFERDKDDLRALGIPIEIGGYDPLFDDASGYRINRDAFELPEITLAPDEAAVLGLAARVWQQAGLAAATSDALLKLKAAGVELDREMLDVAQPQVSPDEPVFEPFWEAVSTRRTVRFGYRKAGAATSEQRLLEPWGIVSYRSRWYVVGHDVERDAPRLFRMSRVTGDVELVDEPGSFDVPEGTDIRALTGTLAPPAATGERTATLRVRPGRAVALRHRHDNVAEAGEPQAGEGWERLTVRFGHVEPLAEELTAYGPDVVVDEPEDLREAVRARLAAVVRSA